MVFSYVYLCGECNSCKWLTEWNVLLSCPIKNDNKLPHFTSESSVYNAWLLQNAFGNLAYGVTCVTKSNLKNVKISLIKGYSIRFFIFLNALCFSDLTDDTKRTFLYYTRMFSLTVLHKSKCNTWNKHALVFAFL